MGSSDQPSPMNEIQRLLQTIKRSTQRYQQAGDPAALDEAVVTSERILNYPDILRAEPSLMVVARNNAGGLYLQRYWVRGEE